MGARRTLEEHRLTAGVPLGPEHAKRRAKSSKIYSRRVTPHTRPLSRLIAFFQRPSLTEVHRCGPRVAALWAKYILPAEFYLR